MFACVCVFVCVCVQVYVGVFMAFLSLRFPSVVFFSFFFSFLLSITSSKNPYRRPLGEFQSHFVYRRLDGGLDDRVSGGEQQVAAGEGRRRAGGNGGRSSCENPHRLADQSGRKESEKTNKK